MKKSRKWTSRILLIIFAAVFLGSGYVIIDRAKRQKKNDRRLNELSTLLIPSQKEQHRQEEKTDTNQESAAENPRESRLLTYDKIKEQNSDLVGWIKIEQTKIDYPVLQSPDYPNFYLDHDFDKNPSSCGVPYAAEECRLNQDCKNIVVYGHHMKNGSMFAALNQYLDREFWESHSVIQFDTLEEYGDYQVMAVFTVNAADEGYPLMQWIWTEDKEQFMHYVFYAKNESIYDTGITAEWGDDLLSLITCEYTHKDGRLIVVAKRMKDGKEELKMQKSL